MNKTDSLAKASKDLMLKEPFYGFFLIMLNKVWNTPGVNTAAVSKNGINYQLSIDEEFWGTLVENHKMGVLKHELLHIALFHLTNYHKYSDRKLANIAMDMEINQLIEKGWLPADDLTKEEYDAKYKPLAESLLQQLKDDQIDGATYKEEMKKIPPRLIFIEDYADLNLEPNAGTRYYYDKLRQAKEDKEKNGTSGCKNMDELLDGDDPTSHDTWEEFDDLSEAEKKIIDKQLDRLLKESATQTEKKRGTIPGELRDHILQIGKIDPPKFDWRGYVRRFTGTSTRVFTRKLRRKHNKRYEGNPGLKIKMRQHMLLAIDTSGSVCNDELREFMSEIHHIYKTGVAVTIVQCDTKIVSIEEFTGKTDNIKIGGRGGTSFDPVIDYFNANLKKYTSLVYFTDGEAWTGLTPKAPTLWVLSERSSMNDSLPGKVIKLEL
jgi:predicted metal-dependent peptidase